MTRRPENRTLATAPGHDRGAVIPLIALLLPVLMIMTAMAIDLGRQRAERRDMQAVADVVSLDMARLADGRTIDEIVTGDADHPAAAAALAASAVRNDIPPGQLTLDWGTWDEVTGYTSSGGVGTAIPDAAWVVAESDTDYFFQPGSGHVEREAIATYAEATYAAFTIGSYAATLSTEQATLLDGALTPLLGSPAGLDVASYQGLAVIELGVDDLGAELGLFAPDEVLDTTVDLDDFVLAAAEVMRNGGYPAEATLLEGMLTTEIQALTVRLGDLVSAEPGNEGAAMAASVDVISALRTSAFLAQCTPEWVDYDDCTAVSIPELSLATPIVSSTSSLQFVETPRYHYGPTGTGTQTSQAGISTTVELGAQEVGQCTPTLANLLCVLDGLLVGWVDVAVTADVDVQLAGGSATIDDIDCADPAGLELLVGTLTDLYSASVTVTLDFGRRGLLGGLLGSLIGSMILTGSTTEIDAADSALFTVAPDVLGETVRSTGSGPVALAGLSLSADSTAVLDTLDLLEIDLTLSAAITTYVEPLLAEIDDQLVTALSEMVGLRAAGADLTAEAIDCELEGVTLAR